MKTDKGICAGCRETRPVADLEMVNLIRVRRVGNQVYREGRRAPDFHMTAVDIVHRRDFRWMAAVRSNKILSIPFTPSHLAQSRVPRRASTEVE
jgi:hypothetical protein